MRARRLLRRSVHGLILGLVVALLPALAGANGVPVTIVLSYLDGVSTCGPRSATGVAELVAREGELRLNATGLPRLDGEEYRVWIINTASGQRMPLASFNAGADGGATLDLVLEETIPDAGWNLMLISVENPASRAEEPSARRSLAGRFPVPGSAQGRPAELPRTGGAEASGGPLPLGSLPAVPTLLLTAAGIAAAWLLGVHVGRRGAGGESQ